MNAVVDLADVVVLQDGGIAGIRSVVCSAMVDAATGGESQARIESLLVDQPS
jgi:hypothetical protein